MITMNDKFEGLSLRSELLENLAELKFDFMTPIQSSSLLGVLEGIDVLAQAKTGSGKTAVFALGILNSLNIDLFDTQALVICPTRELAEQVAKEIRTLARMLKNVKVITICGGVQEVHQEKSLSYGAHIVVGTPGRILRLLSKGSLDFSAVKTFVLDEADRMLDMGFQDDIMEIASDIPEDRQTLFFSATFPEEIKKFAGTLQRDGVVVKVDSEHASDIIDQIFYQVPSHQDKGPALLKLLAQHKPDRTIVFCKTKHIAASMAKLLNKKKIVAEALHGDMMQNERTSVLTKFSNYSLSVLVATDLAARGLDIEQLAAVINLDLPSDPDIYIHRIGRTGRAGQKGQALSLYVPEENSMVEEIEQLTKKSATIKYLDEICSSLQYDLIPTMKTIYLSGGKKSKLRPGDILGALVGEAQLDVNDVGNISILNIVSYVAIKRESVDQAISKLRDGKIKNKKFKVGLA